MPYPAQLLLVTLEALDRRPHPSFRGESNSGYRERPVVFRRFHHDTVPRWSDEPFAIPRLPSPADAGRRYIARGCLEEPDLIT